MNLETLFQHLKDQHGHFHCQSLNDPTQYKDVPFRHLVLPPEDADVPNTGELPAFYRACSAVVFFYIENSEDGARYLARPQDWADLFDHCMAWFEGMDDDEWQDCVPAELLGHNGEAYFLNALVIGETPHTGNYILMDKTRGTVYEFDHDGFEFSPVAADILQYAALTLNPDAVRLADYASHMRFVDDDNWQDQWVIDTLHYADGRSLTLDEDA